MPYFLFVSFGTRHFLYLFFQYKSDVPQLRLEKIP